MSNDDVDIEGVPWDLGQPKRFEQDDIKKIDNTYWGPYRYHTIRIGVYFADGSFACSCGVQHYSDRS